MRLSSVPRLALALLVSGLISVIPASSQTASTLTQADRVVAHPDFAARVQLKDTLPGWVTPSRDAGPMPDAQPVGFTVVVARVPEVQAAFEKLLEDQQNPNSPHFHRWLTPEQIGAQYGPTEHDLTALTAWLSSEGLTVTGISPNRVLVHVSGPSVLIARAFNTSFRIFTVRDEAHYSIASEPSIPAALRPLVQTLYGLVQIPIHPMHHIEPATLPTKREGASPMFSGNNNTVHYVFPADFATIFDINPLYTASITGTGQKVAIIGQSHISNSDITTFESISGLTTNTPNTIVVPAPAGVDPGTIQNDEGESDLDLQRVIGVAPGVTADFVISGSVGGLQGIDVAMNYVVDTVKDPVMTLSYGACEYEAGQSGDAYFNTLFGNAAAEGISVLVSSGDSAAAGCDSSFQAPPAFQKLSINFICANPYSTCVGGTEFNDTASPGTYWSANNNTSNEESALGYIPEGAWNESTPTSVGGSGGGVSTFISKPSFQAGAGIPADNFRDVPDVSFPSASRDGYFGCQADVKFSSGGTGDCATGGGIDFSGTSAAAPGWAGVVALLNQKLGTSQGSLNPLIYRLANLSTGSPFHDVTPVTAGVSPCDLTQPSLCNNTTPSSTSLTGGQQGYAVTTGFDLVTGWGSVDVNNFVTAAVTSSGLTPTTTTLAANPASITTAQTVVFTATVAATAGTPAGTVQFSSNGTALGAPVNLVNRTATSPAESFNTIGTYTISASYAGSNTFSDSAATPVLLNVVAAGKTISTTTLTATALAGTPGTPIGFSATVAGTGGTPTGTVQFLINGINDGAPVTLANGTASLPAADLAAGSDVVTAVYSGDNTFSASTSNAVTVAVTAPASSTSIALSATTTSPTGNLVFSGTVTGTAGGPTPSGTLTLNQVGQGAILNPITLSNGSVVVDVSGASVGSYTVFWAYSGDANYAPSNSPNVTFTVTSTFVPTYGLMPASSTVNTVAGTTASNTITIGSGNGFAGSVALSCSAVYTGSSADTIILPTCAFSPTSTAFPDSNAIVVPAGVTDTVALTLTTVLPQAVHRADARVPVQPGPGTRLPLYSLAAMAGLMLLAVPGTRKRRRWSALAAFLILLPLSGLVACGSGSSSTTQPIGVTISPAAVSLTEGGTQQFSAAVTNTTNTAVTWALGAGSTGTISAAGLYTAPATVTTQQTATVTATSVADPTKSASATITLTPPTAPKGTPSGNYTITVTGTSTGAPNVTTTFTLAVQ